MYFPINRAKMPGKKNWRLILRKNRAYVEAAGSDGPMSLTGKVSGYGDADAAGFGEFSEVLLPFGRL
jgi:hypothetical protein